MAKAWGYGRISDPTRDEKPEAQEYACRKYYEDELSKTHEWGGFLCDLGVSGGTEIGSRPEGSKLCRTVEEGDVVILSKLDRGFRNTLDLLATWKVWEQLGVHLVALDLKMDTQSAVGKLFVKLLGIMAEWERNRISERMKDFFASRKRQGRPYCKEAPYGFKLVGPKGDRRFAPAPEIRRVGRLIVTWKMQGHTIDEIFWALIRRGERRKNGKEWSRSVIHKMLHAELRLQEKEKKDGVDGTTPGS